MTKLHKTLLILALFLTVIFTSAITTALLAPRGAVAADDMRSMVIMIGSMCSENQNQVNKLKQRVSDIEDKLKMEGGW